MAILEATTPKAAALQHGTKAGHAAVRLQHIFGKVPARSDTTTAEYTLETAVCRSMY